MKNSIKILIGIGSAAVVAVAAFFIYKKVSSGIGKGEDKSSIGGKPVASMTPEEIKALPQGSVKISDKEFSSLTPEQQAALTQIKADILKTSGNETGEGTPIYYIAPEFAGYKDRVNTNKLDIRILEGVFDVGDVVRINHPGYKGDYTIEKWWDSDKSDGSGSFVISEKYKDTGERNPDPGYGYAMMDSRKGGTVELLAEATSLSFSAAGGKGIKRFLTKVEAKLRKDTQKKGRTLGKKGVQLRQMIRTEAQEYRKKKAAEDYEKMKQEAEKKRQERLSKLSPEERKKVIEMEQKATSGRGFDGWANLQGEGDDWANIQGGN